MERVRESTPLKRVGKLIGGAVLFSFGFKNNVSQINLSEVDLAVNAASMMAGGFAVMSSLLDMSESITVRRPNQQSNQQTAILDNREDL